MLEPQSRFELDKIVDMIYIEITKQTKWLKKCTLIQPNKVSQYLPNSAIGKKEKRKRKKKHKPIKNLDIPRISNLDMYQHIMTETSIGFKLDKIVEMINVKLPKW